METVRTVNWARIVQVAPVALLLLAALAVVFGIPQETYYDL